MADSPPSLPTIKATVSNILYNCLPVLGVKDSMHPLIRREMKHAVETTPLFKTNVMTLEQVVLLLMLISIKKLRIPCNKHKVLNALYVFNTIYTKKEFECLLSKLNTWYI